MCLCNDRIPLLVNFHFGEEVKNLVFLSLTQEIEILPIEENSLFFLFTQGKCVAPIDGKGAKRKIRTIFFSTADSSRHTNTP